MRVAALTMVYNEPLWAPVWARHFAAQVGAPHCYMLDHGSSDHSLAAIAPPINIEHLPRSMLDEEWRAGVIASRVTRLLQDYDAVFHTDADELLVADPARWCSLAGWASEDQPAVVTAAGFDVQHIPGAEPALDPTQPMAQQRTWLRFSASMCKPAFTRRTLRWSPGFHSADAPLVCAGLYLLHFRFADLDAGLRRLARTRAQAYARPEDSRHQRVPDDEFSAMLHAIAQLPRREEPITMDAAPLRPWLTRLFQDRLEREGDRYKLDLSLSGDELWSGRALLQALSV